MHSSLLHDINVCIAILLSITTLLSRSLIFDHNLMITFEATVQTAYSTAPAFHILSPFQTYMRKALSTVRTGCAGASAMQPVAEFAVMRSEQLSLHPRGTLTLHQLLTVPYLLQLHL